MVHHHFPMRSAILRYPGIPHFQKDPAMIFVIFLFFYVKILKIIQFIFLLYLHYPCNIHIYIYTYLYKHCGLTIAFPWWFPRGFDRGKLTVSELENHHFILGNQWTTWTIFNSIPFNTHIYPMAPIHLHEIAMKNSQAEKNIIIYILYLPEAN